jgi:serine protease Do
MKKLIPFILIALILMGASLLSSEDKQITMLNGASESVVTIMQGTTRASGFFVGENYILTAYHNVDEGETSHVSGIRGGTYYKVHAIDKKFDLALIKTDEYMKGKSLKLSSSVTPGQDAYTIGFPKFLDKMIVKGLVSHVYDNEKMRGLIFDINAYDGSSGSPVLNSKGEVIGLVKGLHKEDTSFITSVHIRDIKSFLIRNGVQ